MEALESCLTAQHFFHGGLANLSKMVTRLDDRAPWMYCFQDHARIRPESQSAFKGYSR